MTKGNKSRFTNKDELNNQAREKETSSEAYLDASKTYDSDQTFQKHFAVFLANVLGFSTSSDDKANRYGIDVNAAEEVNQPKFEYLKKQWESMPQNQPHLVDQYVTFITEAKGGEEKLGFAKNEQGKFDFPKHFKDFLQKRVEQDWKNNNSEKDVNEYWASKSQNGKDELINQYEKSVNKSKPQGKDLSVEELQQWRDNKINDLHSRYDKRSLQGIKELETVIEYTASGQGAIKESPSILENVAKTAYNTASNLISGVSAVASSVIGLAGLSSLFGTADATVNTRYPTRTPTQFPTKEPTKNPTTKPTTKPTAKPTGTPTTPTSNPTGNPTGIPTFIDNNPCYDPETGSASICPPTIMPTISPTRIPTFSPTSDPTSLPTNNPTFSPTKSPTSLPTNDPTFSPTNNPTFSPTNNPTFSPTKSPTSLPTNDPTFSPTNNPTFSPTNNPTFSPTKSPTSDPTSLPTNNPTFSPTKSPTSDPTSLPTNNPTFSPTKSPTNNPTFSPTQVPTLISDNPCAVNQTFYDKEQNKTISKIIIDCPPEKAPDSFFETPGGRATAAVVTTVGLLGLLVVGRKIAKDLAPGTICKPKEYNKANKNEQQLSPVSRV